MPVDVDDSTDTSAKTLATEAADAAMAAAVTSGLCMRVCNSPAATRFDPPNGSSVTNTASDAPVSVRECDNDGGVVTEGVDAARESRTDESEVLRADDATASPDDNDNIAASPPLSCDAAAAAASTSTGDELRSNASLHSAARRRAVRIS
jgi:hypothetical protein